MEPYFGPMNPNYTESLTKMTITNKDTEKEITVLYNPQSYTRTRSVNYSTVAMLGTNAPVVQFNNGSGETVSFELFFDSLSAGFEVGGEFNTQKQFQDNKLRTIGKKKDVDIRKYTSKIYNLMLVEPTVHRPPRLMLSWASLHFEGYLSQCEQNFTKFDTEGYPVRAILRCTFIQAWNPEDNALSPNESPDTAKYRTVCQGDSLWAMSAREYGSPEQWRSIAEANGIVNPRRLRSGEMLVVPALD